jgi:hypothetical protein
MDHDRIVEQLRDRCKCFIEPILQVNRVICPIDGLSVCFEGVRHGCLSELQEALARFLLGSI